MADIKDKLRQLKKEREARSKSQIIKDTWEKMEKAENLSLKEKLNRLINLTREEKPQKPPAVPFEPLKREPLQFFENPYPLDTKYGKIVLSSGLEIKATSTKTAGQATPVKTLKGACFMPRFLVLSKALS